MVRDVWEIRWAKWRWIALLLALGYAGGQALKRSAPFLKGVQAGILMEQGKRKRKESEPVQKLKKLADK